MAPDLLAALAAALVAAVLALVARTGRPRTESTEPFGRWVVRFPRGAAFPAADAAEWFAALLPWLGPAGPGPWFELRADRDRAELALGAPRSWEGSLRAHLAARFPAARLEAVPEPEPRGPVFAVPMAAEKPDVLPLRVPGVVGPDPLPGLAAALAGPFPAGVRATLAFPPADWKQWAPFALAALRQGVRPPPRGWRFRLLLLWDLALGGALPWAAPARGPDLANARRKASAPVFAARIAAWAEAPTGEEASRRAATVAAHLGAAFRDPLGNALAPAGPPRPARSPGDLGPLPLVVLSAAELGSLFHVPAGDSRLLPGEASRVAPLPPESLAGRAPDEGPETVLGEAWADGAAVHFGVTQAERRQHLYVVGKTGTGKSTLLANLVRQDLEAGRGFALVDPHGDLAERALGLVPPSRAEGVAYLDPADRDWPVGLNLLHAAAPGERPLVASGVVGAFKKLWGDSWGPRLEHFLRNAVLLLLEDDEPSLAALPRVFADAGYRQRLLGRSTDPLLRGFFLDEYERADPRWRTEAVAPILNKVGQFLSSPTVRHVVGQKGPGLPLGRAMDEGLAVVANLSAGRIGEDGSALIGGLLVAGLQLAAMRRAERPEAERRDFALVVDEFQRFENEAFAQILSEARKYRLSLVLSHQYLGQLSRETAEAVIGNAGSLAAFRVGAPDAARLARELAPAFGAEDLVNLPDFRFAARVRRGGETVPAFSARTLPPPAPEGDPAAVVAASRRRWARPRAEVETEIADLWEGRTG